MGRGGYGRGLGRVGVWYLLLLVLGAAGSLVLAWHFEFGVAETAVPLLLSLGAAYLAWVSFQRGTGTGAADLGVVADRVAQAVKKQWDDEAAIRRVEDPYPLPVAWRAADPELVESWPRLAGLAHGRPGGPPGDPSGWAPDPAALAGADADIGEVFARRVPTRRLVVLDEPGAGKSVLLIRLLQDLCERRPDGGPVPVLFSLASWDPDRRPLRTWLAEQLRRAHEGLRAPVPAAGTGRGRRDLADALLDARLILPLLDGLDELPPALHAPALDAINRALPPRQPMVLASRTVAWRTALTRTDAMVRLNGAAGIHLLPLAPDQAAAYLRRDAGGEHTPAADRWDTVIARLGTTVPVAQALSTPLGLFLARTIYNPRPQAAHAPGPAPHPDDLCDTSRFPDRAALDTHLFHAFIPAAYTRHHPRPPRWTAARAHRALVFLAHHLENHHRGNPDLAWWELHHALPVRPRRLVTGLVVGLAFGYVYGPDSGLMAGLVAGARRRPGIPSTRLRWSPRRLARGLVIGVVSGLLSSAVLGPAVGFVLGLVIGLLLGLEGEKPDLATTIGPIRLFALDRRAFLAIALVPGIAVGVALGIGLGPWHRWEGTLGYGVTLGSGIAVAVGVTSTVWADFVVARAYLAVRRQVPRDLLAFLQDAHEHRGVLRQVGAVYQFRHIDLQHHLARQPWPPPPARAS